MVEDDQGKPEEAVSAVQKLINSDRFSHGLKELARDWLTYETIAEDRVAAFLENYKLPRNAKARDYSLVPTDILAFAEHAVGSAGDLSSLAKRMQSGTVWINCHSMYDNSLPIGGVKASGWGRDSGQVALDGYLEWKTVCAVV